METANSDINILIVEDSKVDSALLEKFIQDYGYRITDIAPNAEKALESLNSQKPDLILMDILLEKSINGIELARKIRENHNIPIIFVTSLHAGLFCLQVSEEIHMSP